MNKAKSSKSKKIVDNNDKIDKLMSVYNETECNKGSRPSTAFSYKEFMYKAENGTGMEVMSDIVSPVLI